MKKNVTGQKVTLFAFDATTNAPKTGDAANLTAYVSKDDGAVTVLGDTSATEKDATNAPGVYEFDLTQAETNADKLLFTGKSSTANVKLVPKEYLTRSQYFADQSINSSGQVTAASVVGAVGSVTGAVGSVTGNVGGNVAGSVGSIATGGIAAASFAAGAIDNAAIATDAIGSAELAATAVTEIQSGLATQASVDVIDDFLDTEIAAIKAKTDNLPTDPADASDIAASFTSIAGTLSTIAGYLDTEIAAIKAKTDNLPTDPADASDIAASFTSISSTLTTIAGYVDTEVAAIKAKTDNLPASPAAVGSPMTLAADAVSAAALAADAVAEIQSGLATAAALTTVDDFLDTEIASILTALTAIQAQTDLIPPTPASTGDAMALTGGERNSVADALLDRANAIETGLTLRQAHRLIAAALAGELSGAATNTILIRNAVADSKVRLTATVDSDGNRTSVTADTT